MIAVVANFIASFLAGFVVFSALGHMSWRLNKQVATVVEQASSISFIAYPEILATFKYPTFFSIMFFLMVINLGLDSDFGGLEAMYTALSDEYLLLKRHRKTGMFIMCCILVIACLPTVTYGNLENLFRFHCLSFIRWKLCGTIFGQVFNRPSIDVRCYDGSHCCKLGKKNIFVYILFLFYFSEEFL